MTKHSPLALALFLFGCWSTSNAQTTFVDIAQSSGANHRYETVMAMGGGCALFDYDNDGDIDIYATGGFDVDRLFRNNGDGTFTDVSTAAGINVIDSVETYGVTTGDIDNDGDREILVTSVEGFTNTLFLNNGDGTFTDITNSAGLGNDVDWGHGSAFGDYNLDGYLDLYIGNYADSIGFIMQGQDMVGFSHDCFPNTLYMNNGDGTFTDVTAVVGGGLDDDGCTLVSSFTDYDNDGDMDILNANDFGAWIGENRLHRNEYPNDTFSDVGAAANIDAAIYSMGIAVGDYDQDLDLDYYITNIGRNVLHKNNGDGTFTDTTTAAGVENAWVDTFYTTGWAAFFLDIDNNMDLDLFVANGWLNAAQFLPPAVLDPDKLYYNNGDGTFADSSDAVGLNSVEVTRGGAFGDIDNDGDVDVVTVPIDIPGFSDGQKLSVFENTLASSANTNWLKVELEGVVNNRDGYGSHLIIHVGGKSWLHEISGGDSHLSQNSSIAHFGLKDQTVVDSLEVIWPGGGRQVIENISANQTLKVVENVTGITKAERESIQFGLFPNPAKESATIHYQLNETAEVELNITDLLGRTIWSQAATTQVAGSHRVTWTKQDQSLAEGVYFVQLKVGDKQLTKKLMIRK